MSEHCDTIRELLSPYLDGELRGPDLARVESHLPGCPGCRGILESMRGIDRLAAGDEADPGGAYFQTFLARVDERIDAEDARAAARRSETARPGGGPSFGEHLREFLFGTRHRRAVVFAAGLVLVVIGGREVWRASSMRDAIRSQAKSGIEPLEESRVGEEGPDGQGIRSDRPSPEATYRDVEGRDVARQEVERKDVEREDAGGVGALGTDADRSANATEPGAPPASTEAPAPPEAAEPAAGAGDGALRAGRDGPARPLGAVSVPKEAAGPGGGALEDRGFLRTLDAGRYASFVDSVLRPAPEEAEPVARAEKPESTTRMTASDEVLRLHRDVKAGAQAREKSEVEKSAGAPSGGLRAPQADVARILEAALLAQDAGKTELAKRGFEIVEREGGASPAAEEAAFRLLCLEHGVPQSAAQGLEPAAAFARGVDGFRAFLREHPSGRFASLATLYLAEGLYRRWKETRAESDRREAIGTYRRYRALPVDRVGEIYSRTAERLEELGAPRSAYR